MVFPEEDNVLQLVKSGQIDVAEVPISAYSEEIDGYKLVEFESPRAQGFSLPYLPDTGLTTADAGSPIGNNVTSDPAIRKALNIGINREEIVNSVYKGLGKPEYTGVDSLPFANEQAKITDNRPDEAKQILEEAGWVDTDGDGIREKDGLKASFEVYYPSNKQDRQSLATIISEQAKDLGIEIVLQSADWDTIYTKMYSQAVVMQQSSDNPYSAVYQQYHSKTPEELVDSDYRNPNAYNSSEVDAILEQGMNAGTLEDAYQYWSQAAYTGSGAGFGPNADAPWLWAADNHYGYFVKDDINMGTLSKLGQDYYCNILDWTREGSSS
jgi:peptide/nickel transport system substrate-binding protein